jgi:hypothetical protein
MDDRKWLPGGAGEAGAGMHIYGATLLVSATLILFVGAIYLIVAIDQFLKGSPMFLAWLGYAIANVGLAWAAK